jgi:type I restriction enzyme R subunit
VSFTKGRIIVRGKLLLMANKNAPITSSYYKSNIPLAVIEAKTNSHSLGTGMQQALNYAETLGVPFVFSSNGDAFLMHDNTGLADKTELELSLDAFPSPAELWQRYCQWKGLE